MEKLQTIAKEIISDLTEAGVIVDHIEFDCDECQDIGMVPGPDDRWRRCKCQGQAARSKPKSFDEI